MDKENELNLSATATIGIAIICSRILGLAREVLFNQLFGSALMGVFLVAFRIPNLLRDLFAEGVLSVAFITIFSKKLESEGNESAWRLASKVFTLIFVLMVAISLLGIINTKYLVALLVPGFSKEEIDFTILLTQIMYPFILMVSLAALVMGVLNAKNIFGVPALASSFFNIGSIVGGTLIAWLIDPDFGVSALIGLAIGTLLGGALQLIIQIPSLKKVGYQFRFDFGWNDKGVRDIFILTIPGILAASAVQINVLINSIFSSYVGAEAITWLNSAFRLVQFPIGIFGVAVSTITLPVISRIIAKNAPLLFGQILAKALRFVIFLTLPAAVLLSILAEPIIMIIYEHGRFTAYDTLQTKLALQLYSLGLIAYASVKVISPAYYVIEKKWTPMIVSLFSILINITLNYQFIFNYNLGHIGLALSTSLAASINFIILFSILSRSHALHLREYIINFKHCIMGSSALALVGWGALSMCSQLMDGSSIILKLFLVTMIIGVSLFVYIIVCLKLEVEGASHTIQFLSSNIRKKAFNFYVRES